MRVKLCILLIQSQFCKSCLHLFYGFSVNIFSTLGCFVLDINHSLIIIVFVAVVCCKYQALFLECDKW